MKQLFFLRHSYTLLFLRLNSSPPVHFRGSIGSLISIVWLLYNFEEMGERFKKRHTNFTKLKKSINVTSVKRIRKR